MVKSNEFLKDRVVREYLVEKRSIRQIALAIGRSYGYVHKTLKDAGVEMRSRGGRH